MIIYWCDEEEMVRHCCSEERLKELGVTNAKKMEHVAIVVNNLTDWDDQDSKVSAT